MEITQNGKIIKGVGGLYQVRILSGDAEKPCNLVQCRARGSFRHNGITPLPGDMVTIMEEQTADLHAKDGGGFVIDRIHTRRNSLIRPALANLDLLFVTMAAASPEPILTTVDKLIAIAEFNQIEPVIVITKCELAPKRAEELAAIYRTAGFSVFPLSATEDIGVLSLEEFIASSLSGKTAAFAGASGVGKSTLLNRLFPSLNLSTFAISRKIQRGRHTTRQVELFPMSDAADCGYIADTPGFSMLDFERFDFFTKDDLPLTMREFVPYIGQCRYTKCSHTKEEGCAILQAVRDGAIPLSRHESYRELYDTLKQKKQWNDTQKRRIP